ncbi:ribonuclease 1-like [Typha latifolia]|uniref:ribonuclease 1-like n=1 Tax=Typha latifolia TaxID=4733 RepID=UPI003C2DDC5B
MKTHSSLCFLLLALHLLIVLVSSSAKDFDFFYFVQQWPGSYCDTKRSCCYPVTGKPDADFGIHGLWPNYNDGSYPSNCDPDSPFDSRKIKDLMPQMKENWPTLACPRGDGLKFWAHEWDKHGTCSESVLDQHSYFETALNLQKKVNILTALLNAGIEPDGRFYSLTSIKNAIKLATGITPGIECNRDESGNTQLLEIYLCVDSSGQEIIECPVYPRSRCTSRVEFPSFEDLSAGDVTEM